MPYFVKELGLPIENIETLFDEIDKDHNNEITRDELYDFFLEHRDMVELPTGHARRLTVPTPLIDKAKKGLLTKDF